MTSPSVAATAHVPLVDLPRQHAPIADELRSAFDQVVARSDFVLGEEVERFEASFAAACGVDHCVGVGSGTAALTLALVAAVNEDTGLIDVDSAASVISDRTVAIMAVHLYGQVCDMDALALLARRNNLLLIEDAAQAHGALWRGSPAGSLGDAAAFSFYPSKNLGALGDGGAVCTRDTEIAERCRRLRNLGQRGKGEHVDAGFNERLDGIQAAMLRVKLDRLEESNAARRQRASLYREVLPESCRTLAEDPRGECVYHLFPVRVGPRDQVREHLREGGIGTGVHYWPALHRQPLFSGLGLAAGELANATGWSEEEVSLPMFAELTDEEVLRVGEALDHALAEAGV
jgi:dTDP-4-amino-4,6-dideoxygalactose transaminase